jgi:hypothetical protein
VISFWTLEEWKIISFLRFSLFVQEKYHMLFSVSRFYGKQQWKALGGSCVMDISTVDLV